MSTGHLYTLLGVSASATAGEITSAYQAMVQRFHPSRNYDSSASEALNLAAHAYAILNDPTKRAAYDVARQKAPQSALTINLQWSRAEVPVSNEKQVLYALLELRPALPVEAKPAPLNLCFVVDRSTSMQGERLDQVKSAVLRLIDNLQEGDTLAIVAFSDKAEVILPARTIKTLADRVAAKTCLTGLLPQGSTEILQGLLCGLIEMHRHLNPGAVNHLMLLTDGHTYGDENDSLMLASLAATDGIVISGFGLGTEWNDKFVDDLAARTGGASAYINSPEQLVNYVSERARGMGNVYADQVNTQITLDAGLQLETVFRLLPEAGPMPLEKPLRLGRLPKNGALSALFKFILPPLTTGKQPIARLILQANVIALHRHDERIIVDLFTHAVPHPPDTAPPAAIVDALGKLAQYRLQDRAWQKAAVGDLTGATQTLKTLSTRLLASGQTELAKVAINEAKHLEKTQAISEDAKKHLKYGTRALIEQKS